MKGDPEFVVLRYSAWMPADSEKSILGAIIRYPLSPSTDHVPSSPLQYNKYEILEQTATDFVLSNKGTNTTTLSGSASKIANFVVKGRNEDKVHLQGKLVRIRRLQQVDQFWTALRDDSTVSETVPGWISFWNTWPVCMIVSIMICEDAELGLNSTKSTQTQGTGQIPVSAIAAAAGAPMPPVANPSLAAEKTHEAATSVDAKFSGKQIFAIELRKITTDLFHRKDLKLRSDGPGKVDPTRLAGRDADGEDDEANLDKPAQPKDLICVELDTTTVDDLARGI